MKVQAMIVFALVATGARAATTDSIGTDPTAATLRRCLDASANASTAGQTGCESAAYKNYDRRMNAAYAALIRRLPAAAAQRLRVSQRAWLAFRDSEAAARSALFETRQGTMFVPMQASAATDLVRDRALQLEGYVRVMRID
jgi:uncharacterized protein YecT (DUF1311 family)